MTHSSSTRRALAVAGLAAALLPLTAMPALAYTEPVAAPLASPTGLTPNDQSFPQPVRKVVDLHWGAVAGASAYKVEVGVDDSWSDDPIYKATTVGTTLTLPTWLPHATYVWRVAALSGDTVGHWSSEETHLPAAERDAQFTRGWRPAPTTISPAVNEAASARPEFSWTPVAYASGYEVQVSEDGGFTNGDAINPDTTTDPSTTQQWQSVDYCYTSRTRVTPFTGQGSSEKDNPGNCEWKHLGQGAAKPLFWRVRAFDRTAVEAEDVATTPISANGVPNQGPSTTPNDPEMLSDCPTAGVCTPSHKYEYGQWSTPVPFTSDAIDAPGTYDRNTPVTVHTVNADDPDGLCSAPAHAVDEPEHATCVDFPTLHWDAVPGANRYRVVIGLDDQFDNIALMAESSGLSWTPTEAWRDGTGSQSYYYGVQACVMATTGPDVPGQCGVISEVPSSFTKKSPRSTITSAAPGNTGPIALSWKSYGDTLSDLTDESATSDAYAYHVQVARADHPSFDVTVEDALVDTTTFYPTSSYGEGSFVWRVQAVNASAHKLPWSYSQAFTRDTVAPKAVSVSPDTRITTKTPVKVLFSEVVTGLSSASLTAVTGASTAASTVTVGADGKSATITPTKALVPGASYAVRVASTVKDLAGNAAVNAGPSFTVNPIADNTNAAITYSAGWTKLASSNAYGGSYTQSAAAGRSLTMPFYGPAVAVVGCLGPNSGYADISVGSVKKRVSLYRSYSGCGVKLASLTGLGAGVHTVKVVVLGQHVSKSKGNNVGIDFLTAGA